MSEAPDYLDESAAKLKSQHPQYGDYISELLKKYKKTLEEGLLQIGDTPLQITANFEKDVIKYCARAEDSTNPDKVVP